MKTTASTFPIGYYFHTFDGDPPSIELQGKVISTTGKTCSAQLFSWIDGEPTTIQNISAEQMKNARFYRTNKEWRDAAEQAGTLDYLQWISS